MGTGTAGSLTIRRPRWRAYLLLARVSNVPTVWTNVLAGVVAGAGTLDPALFARVAAAVSLSYTAGMFLNDAFDAEFDASARPERPVPAGDVTRREAFRWGSVLLGAGLLLLPARPGVLAFGALLAAAIVLYDARHKRERFAPVVMGICRGVVYCVGAAAAGGITAAALIGAAAITVYVSGLTVVARAAAANARWLVPALIAGISLLDAGFVLLVTSSAALALTASAAFPLTLLLQRFVPGD